MKKNGKKITALLLVLAMLMSVATIGVSAADKRDVNGYYAPDASTKTRRVYFAMPGCWESDYWRNNGSTAGAYWWTGVDTIDWLGYKMAKETGEASVTNVYTTLLPCGGDNAITIIFNNFVDGLIPSIQGYTKERNDAAMQTVDSTNSYHSIGGSNYYSKELWMYVYDKLAEFMEYPEIQWDAPDNPKFSTSELAQTKPLVAQVLTEYEGYTNEKFMEKFDIPEFGEYAKNFFFDFDNQSGMALGFGDMMYVCNLDPNSLNVSYTYVPEGKITSFNGDYFFYYGNGEYGTWPTKELLKEKTGIEFVDGQVVAPETVKVDAYGNAVKTLEDADGNKITYMIAGTVNGAYATNKQLPEIPSSSSSSASSSYSDSTLLSFRMTENGTLALTNCNGKITSIPEEYPDSGDRYSVDDPFNTEGDEIDYSNIPITAIDDWVFANNKYIESVEIPDSIESIGKGAFYNCVNLKNITLPKGLTKISPNTFEKCLYLENITLGKQMKSIGDEAFYDCRRLKTLDIPDSVTEIGEEAFTNCRSLTSLTIPKGVKKLGSEDSVGFGVFENCKNLQEITIPETVDYIQPNAFDGCKSITLLGASNSYAQQYAADNHLLFKAIQPDDSLVGDVSGDSRVDVTDATLVQMFAAEFTELNATQQKAADTNHDGKVDVTDATLIQMYAAEVIDHF